MPATEVHLEIEQGATLEIVVGVFLGGVIVNITGYTAKMQIRPDKDSSTVLAEYSSPSDAITVDGLNGQVVVSVPFAETAGYAFLEGVYDLELTSQDGQKRWRLVEGNVRVNKEVTRS